MPPSTPSSSDPFPLIPSPTAHRRPSLTLTHPHKNPTRFPPGQSEVFTTKYLTLEDKGVTGNVQMAQISNGPITHDEFEVWNRHCDASGTKRVTKRDAALAAAAIDKGNK